MGSSMGFTCLLLLVTTLGKNHFFVCGGCSGKCCRGRDLSCMTTDWRMDRVYGTCYCDEGCVRTKDCCFDHFTECPAQACAVSSWSFWSGCAKPCQPSVRVRVRHVEQQPSNSGEPCPSLEEQSGCREYRDHQGKPCGLNSGPALITSMEFSKGRPKHDHYGNPLNPGFCVEFTLESRTPHCTVQNRPHTHWMRYITEGFKVCVACEPPAMRNNSGSCQGDGQESDKEALLRWQAVGNHQCSGTWRKIQRTQHCNCPTQHSFVFI
ncbi:somatomedin-B and thrombospondin type-1 domain-containing protein [Notolabrus celidotus]|uniref:somatomedin-B and thrombospondin type-1 domain-containing protein n=1 Tax=Notolabrus celidotus TaxID=1203425 RepID=UPI0014901E0D|nr:somatomedin-B and thrombospondin type-1 domain-containing protein [Notolabrus celidotus]XP_034562624.1 somatomedin-B and thrombospondin type-1 domain-containing protein [Notolabrus celidotus]XP_034562625.1 somatomedin-B and thrombospondin type-1 domain-containing protein [Notolabrus celidotus]XP_034562626.1 somatomedin-B and thrombospondin type-1 domain-containing protein [Notolabrus celidotus]XP_034562627.1 somatomedin-B and thrombospondin type-1 domain-containing protein [Notolabrus celido